MKNKKLKVTISTLEDESGFNKLIEKIVSGKKITPILLS